MDELSDALAGPRQLKEPGSPGWCIQTVRYLKDHIRHVDEQWRQADQVLAELTKFKAWLVIPPGKPYGKLNEMLKAEVGIDERAIKDAIKKAELATQGRPKKGDIVTFSSGDRGNSETYTVRRLRRDHPDLADRVDQGKLTANAAAVEAGFRPRTKTIRIDDPESAARSLRKHMPPAARHALARLLLDEQDPT